MSQSQEARLKLLQEIETKEKELQVLKEDLFRQERREKIAPFITLLESWGYGLSKNRDFDNGLTLRFKLGRVWENGKPCDTLFKIFSNADYPITGRKMTDEEKKRWREFWKPQVTWEATLTLEESQSLLEILRNWEKTVQVETQT